MEKKILPPSSNRIALVRYHIPDLAQARETYMKARGAQSEHEPESRAPVQQTH